MNVTYNIVIPKTFRKKAKTGLKDFRDFSMTLSQYFILYTLYFSYEMVA